MRRFSPMPGTSCNTDLILFLPCSLRKYIGIKSEMKQKVWYGRGIGQVKTEGYSKKGKLLSVNELVEVTGL